MTLTKKKASPSPERKSSGGHKSDLTRDFQNHSVHRVYGVGQKIHAMPGKEILLQGYANITGRYGTFCSAPMHSISAVTLDPSYIFNYYPSALNGTTFDRLNEDRNGYIEKEFLPENPVNFLLWDPGNYTIYMLGRVRCDGAGFLRRDYQVRASATIIVENLASQVFFNESKSSVSFSYNSAKNTLNLGYNLTVNTSKFESKYEIGWLSVVGSLKLFSIEKYSSSTTPKLLAISRESLLCADVAQGKICNSGIIKGSSATIASVFAAPYISMTQSCDYSNLNQILDYEAEIDSYQMYMMVKAKNTSFSSWVPAFSLELKNSTYHAHCSNEVGCGVGLGSKEELFSSPWQVDGPAGRMTPASLGLPWWYDTLQEDLARSPYIALAAYFEGSTGNSWIICQGSPKNNAELVTTTAYDESFHESPHATPSLPHEFEEI